MNYFNYFTEIEDEFVRRRGKHMLVSPLDWSLIETWRQRGIPLRIALRGITQSFDTYDQQSNKLGRKVNSLLYCQPAVEEAYQQFLTSQVGSQEEETAAAEADEEAGFSMQALRDAISEWRLALQRTRDKHGSSPVFSEALERAAQRLDEISHEVKKPDHRYLEQLDSELTLIEKLLLEAAAEAAGEERIASLMDEAGKELKSYKSKMEKEVFEQTLRNRVSQKLRTEYGLPRLSLFNI